MVMRISGLGSGMDIDGMVKKLMTAESMYQTREKQQIQSLSWKQDAFRSINTMATSLTGSAYNLRFATNWQKTAATTSDATKITVSSDSSATPSSHSIGVTQLAAGTSNISSATVTRAGMVAFDPNATLASQASNQGFSLVSNSLTINGKLISYDPTVDSLNTVIGKVNNSGAGVTMAYDSFSDKVVLSTNATGAAATINFTGAGNFTGSALDMVNLSGATSGGKDALFTIDGLSTNRPTNQVSLGGVNYNLLSTTVAGQPVTVNVGLDTEAMKKSITDFVSQYNTAITTISTKLNEAKFKDFQPLTDDQKTAMTDSQITAWNLKAQSGLLRGDSDLKKAYNDLRSSVGGVVTNIVGGQYNMLSMIGIGSGPYNANDPTSAGKLIIDDAKLTQALSTDPSSVVKLFSNIGTVGSTDRGIAQKVYDTMNTLSTTLIEKAGGAGSIYDSKITTLGTQVNKLELDVTAWDSKLSTKQDNYYKMFSAMDTAVGNSNSMSSWLQNLKF
jgi:flagellar hook-associated protein 2